MANHAALAAQVQDFHDRFGEDLKKLRDAVYLCGTRELVGYGRCNTLGAKNRNGDFITFDAMLLSLIHAVNADAPRKIPSFYPYLQGGHGLINNIKRNILPEFAINIETLRRRFGKDISRMPEEAQAIIGGYELLTEKLLPEWERDDYLEKLSRELAAAGRLKIQEDRRLFGYRFTRPALPHSRE